MAAIAGVFCLLNCSGMSGGNGGLGGPGAALDSGDGTTGGGGNAVGDGSQISAPNDPQVASNDTMSGGFGDPAKAVDFRFRIMLARFEDPCRTANGQIHTKVHGYLIPIKTKIAPRRLRIVNNGETYQNILTEAEPVPENSLLEKLFIGSYRFEFEITTDEQLPLVFYFHPKDAPPPAQYNVETPCTPEWCAPEDQKSIPWHASVNVNDPDSQRFDHAPSCTGAAPATPAHAEPIE